MIGLITSGLRGVAGAAKVVLQGSADVAKVARDLTIATVSTPIAHVLSVAHGGGQTIMNGAGQMIQLPGAGVASAGAAAQSGLSSLSLPTGGEGLASLSLPAAGGAAGSMAGSVATAAPSAGAASAGGGPSPEFLGVLRPQGTALPLMPEGIMRINSSH